MRIPTMIFGLVVLLICQPSSRNSAAAHPIANPQSHSIKLMWSFDLSSDPDFSLREAVPPQRLRRPALTFLDNGNLVLSFDDGYPSMKPARTANLSQEHTRNPNSSGSFQYHALFIDRKTGTVQERMNWPTETDTSTILGTNDGFIALAGDELRRYSKDYKAIHEFRVPAHPAPGLPRSDFWDAHVAPTGDVVILAHTRGRRTRYEWLRIDDFKSLGDVSLEGFGPFSCTDAFSSFLLDAPIESSGRFQLAGIPQGEYVLIVIQNGKIVASQTVQAPSSRPISVKLVR